MHHGVKFSNFFLKMFSSPFDGLEHKLQGFIDVYYEFREAI